MKILACDVGMKRVGLAMSDDLGMIASPFGVVERTEAINEIVETVIREEVDKIVVGVPYLASGKLGSQADDVWSFIEDLKDRVEVPIDYENEHLTSAEAAERLKLKKKKTKGDVDSMAATIILESYLKKGKE